MKEYFPRADATVSNHNRQREQRLKEAVSAILKNTALPAQLEQNMDHLIEKGFYEGDIREGVMDLLGSGELELYEDGTIRRTDYQLELGMSYSNTSSVI